MFGASDPACVADGGQGGQNGQNGFSAGNESFSGSSIGGSAQAAQTEPMVGETKHNHQSSSSRSSSLRSLTNSTAHATTSSSTNGAIRLMTFTNNKVVAPSYHFLEILQINSIQFNISFTRSVSTKVDTDSGSAATTAAAPIKYLLDTILVIVADIDDAPVQLKSLIILKALGTSDKFIEQVSKHYISSGKRQILGLVGSIGILGNPTALVKNLGSGFHSFFTEPAKGIRKGPKAFGKGAAKGTKKLLAGVFTGAGGTVSAVTGAVGDGVSKLTMDKDFVAARKKRAAKVKKGGAANGVLQGGKAFAGGIASGIGGLFYQPFKGAKQGGVKGFFGGVGKGLVGVVTKPVAGTLEAVSNTFEGVANSARDAGSSKKINRRGRMRNRRILQGDERKIVPWHPLEGILREHLEKNKIRIDPDTLQKKNNKDGGEQVQAAVAVAVVYDSTTRQMQLEEKYLFHIILPDAASLMLVVTTKEIFLLGIHPTISEGT